VCFLFRSSRLTLRFHASDLLAVPVRLGSELDSELMLDVRRVCFLLDDIGEKSIVNVSCAESDGGRCAR